MGAISRLCTFMHPSTFIKSVRPPKRPQVLMKFGLARDPQHEAHARATGASGDGRLRERHPVRSMGSDQVLPQAVGPFARDRHLSVAAQLSLCRCGSWSARAPAVLRMAVPARSAHVLRASESRAPAGVPHFVRFFGAAWPRKGGVLRSWRRRRPARRRSRPMLRPVWLHAYRLAARRAQ